MQQGNRVATDISLKSWVYPMVLVFGYMYIHTT